MTFPELPPRRPLPAEVRERMRRVVVADVLAGPEGTATDVRTQADVRTLTEGRTQAERRAVDDVRAVDEGPGRPRRRARGPLAAAAGAVLLVGAVAVAVQPFHTAPVDTAQGTPVLPVPDGFAAPIEAEVVPTLPQDLEVCGFGGEQAVTVRVPGRRLLITPQEEYCELTYTTVARSDPSVYDDLYVGRSKVLWRSPTGVVILKPAPGTTPIKAAVVPDMPITAKLVDDDHFLMIPQGQTVTVETNAGDPIKSASTELTLRSIPDAALVHDRFPDGSNDPADPKNVLARCLDVAMRSGAEQVDDSGTWKYAAAAGVGTRSGLVALRGPGAASAYCSVAEYKALSVYTAPDHAGDPARPFRMVLSQVSKAGGPEGIVLKIGGTVRDEVTRLEFTHRQQSPQSADVRDGTFVALLPDVTSADNLLQDVTAKAFDRDGRVVYEGRVV
ncbi:hypothetical protein ABZ816_22895 [Actinosynnema sp. NPDC047251]|uniref:Uncharacterized protein n=1 Tax=Saccharothrix espanaensis (strain ATCC 51144 / DSM 44229 / JCM 9112 / NBRC 15066 / NRRL 15764) TaxID=1179773 RepID=K0JZY5_SACES|nr:hypothetical protein [Saccharothrix espanaensis]CCH33550.1 hypothetical protein BN6_63060 [Saccharothrix espanaensis DSM 44229]